MKKKHFSTTAQVPFSIRSMTSTSLLCPLCHYSDSALHILSGCQHQIITGLITERHNVACRLMIKAIEAGSLGGCFVQMDIGSKDRLALQNLKIPVGSTNRTVPEWLIPRRFPSKQRLTTCRPDAIRVTEMPTKKAKQLTDVHPRYALRSRAGYHFV